MSNFLKKLKLLPLLACPVLSACGTNVQWLLAEEGRLTSEADRLATAAETLGTGVEEKVYDAEDAKLEACRFLTEATVQRMQQEPTFAEQFMSDLSSVVVLLVPIAPVETCADALGSYGNSIAQLKQELIDLGVIASNPEESPAGSS